MITLQSIQLFALNVAIVSSLCFAIALGLSRFFVSLPKRYATLAVGLVAGLLAPLVVALGTWCSLGLLPAMPSQPPVAMPIAIDMGAPTQDQLPRSNDTQPQLASDLYLPETASPPYSPKLVINGNADGIAIVNEASQATQRPAWPMIIGTALLALWAVGSMFFLFGQVRKLILCRQFLTGCRPVNDSAVQKLFAHTKERLGINRNVQLLESDRLPTPVVIGCWQPRVILPSEIQLTLSRGQLASVLTHELSHIRRKDHHTATLQTIASLLYWWNPLCRLSSRRISELREMICDDIATAEDVAPREYAQTIVQMAARTVATRELAGSLGISLSPISELERRLKRIIADRAGNVDISISKRFVAALMTVSILLISGLLFAQVPSNSPKQSTDAAPPANVNSTAPATKLGKASSPPAVLTGQVVDTAGKPVANANVYLQSLVDDVETQTKADADGRYRFDVRMRNRDMMVVKLWSKSADESLQGYYQFKYQRTPVPLDNIQLTVEPVKVAKVQVVDANGKPIPNANATISIQLYFPNVWETKKTDANGFASFLIPQSQKVERSIAWKDGSGLDFKTYILHPQDQHADIYFKPSEFPYSTHEVLRLEGAQPFAVRVVDDLGQPIPNAFVDVGQLQKDGGRQTLDLTKYYGMIKTQAASDGTASFDWFPVWQYNSMDIYSHADGVLVTRTPRVLRPKSGHAEIRMQRSVPVRGRVTFADGKPAPGVSVFASGTAKNAHDSYGWAVNTDENGRYEMPVARDQIYRLGIRDEEWTATPQRDISITNQGVDNLDLVLTSTTKLRGKVVSVSTGTGVPRIRLSLTKYQEDPAVLLEPMASPDAARQLPRPIQSWDTLSSEQGEYEFSTGEGFYLLSLSGSIESQRPVRVVIHGERDKDLNFSVQTVEEIELVGRAVSKETGQPLSGVQISSESRDRGIPDQWQVRTDANGQFKVRKKKTACTIVALSSDFNVGTVAMIGPDQAKIELRLEKLGSAQGRLMNEDGTAPLPHQVLSTSRIEAGETAGNFMMRHVGFTNTDDDGKFVLNQLIPGTSYSIHLADDSHTYWLGNVDISVKPGQTTQLGDIKRVKLPDQPRESSTAPARSNVAQQLAVSAPSAKRESTPDNRKFPITELAGQVVDLEGKTVAGATVYYLDKRAGKETPVVTDALGKFRFSVALNESMFMDAILRAESNDGKLQGYFQQPYRRGNSMSPRDIVVNIAPLTSFKVQVLDAAGLPIERANTAIELKYRNMVGPVLTDASGIATFNLPQSEEVASTMAWKDGGGLDYRVYKASNRGHYEYRDELPDLPPDNLQTLKLEGAIPVKVHAVDDQGLPMAGWTIFTEVDRKYGQKDPGIPDCKEWLGAKTNADGWATVNWIPTWQKSPVEFWAFSDGFVAAAKKCYLKSENHTVEIVMYPTISISGRITFTDGEPATYIGVKAHGELDHELREFGGSSGDDGRYEFRVPIDQKYTVSVNTQALKTPFPSMWNPSHRIYGVKALEWELHNGNWTANEHTGVATKRNQNIENIDFVMSRSEANVVDDSDEFDSDR